MKVEYRNFQMAGASVETRKGAAGDLVVIRGHAAVFNQLSQDLGGFRERIRPGAFAESIARDDVRALINHDSSLILGRCRAGTLRMYEDSQGLAVEIDPPDTSYGRDLLVSLKRGDITGMSFGFMVPKGGQAWHKEGDGTQVRTITRATLVDVSPVTYPAYTQTDVGLGAPAGLPRNVRDDPRRQAMARRLARSRLRVTDGVSARRVAR